MSDWLRNSVFYEINTWVWLNELSAATGRRLTLADVPEEAWDQLAHLGVNVVWLMGVWERSPAAVAMALRNKALLSELREKVPDMRPEDLIGSPYSVRRYQVDAHLGGSDALAVAREALARRGIRLFLDFVPNHVAPDHRWVTARPEWLLEGSRTDLRRDRSAFLQTGSRVFARGRDPYFPPWSDVLQLNAFSREQRRAAIGELRKIADQCDGVRCDMAMLVMNDVFARTWGKRVGPAPAEDYWPEVIGALRTSHPEFRFMAEVYWGLEPSLLQQGFDACYDKGLYDQLTHGSAESVRNHLIQHAAVQDKLVRFIENHDEPRAAQVFPEAKGTAAVVTLITLPGIRLLHEGQLDGRTIRAPLHLGRRPDEPGQPLIRKRYSDLLQLASRSIFRTGHWSQCVISACSGDPGFRHLLSWCWQDAGECVLAIVNFSPERARGHVRVPWRNTIGGSHQLLDSLPKDAIEDLSAMPDGEGLVVDLQPWAFRLLRRRLPSDLIPN